MTIEQRIAEQKAKIKAAESELLAQMEKTDELKDELRRLITALHGKHSSKLKMVKL